MARRSDVGLQYRLRAEGADRIRSLAPLVADEHPVGLHRDKVAGSGAGEERGASTGKAAAYVGAEGMVRRFLGERADRFVAIEGFGVGPAAAVNFKSDVRREPAAIRHVEPRRTVIRPATRRI